MITSGTTWETQVGYSRAVRVGNQIFVAGTTAGIHRGEPVGGSDAAAQARAALAKIQAALEEAGSSLGHVVRTRTFLTNIEDWPEVAKAHGEYFGEIRPASTMLAVSDLIEPGLLVEIEADAVISG